MSTDKLPQTRSWTAIPKGCCLLKAELKQLSFVQNKLLKIPNYHCLAACRSIPELQRMTLVMTLTKTTHVSYSTSSFFSHSSSVFLWISKFCLMWSPRLHSSLVSSYICQSVSQLHVCLIKGEQVDTIAIIWWGTRNISIHEMKNSCKATWFSRCETVIHWWKRKEAVL